MAPHRHFARPYSTLSICLSFRICYTSVRHFPDFSLIVVDRPCFTGVISVTSWNAVLFFFCLFFFVQARVSLLELSIYPVLFRFLQGLLNHVVSFSVFFCSVFKTPLLQIHLLITDAENISDYQELFLRPNKLLTRQ